MQRNLKFTNQKDTEVSLFHTLNESNFTQFKNYVTLYDDVPPGAYQHNICQRIPPYDHKTYSIGGKKITFPDRIELHITKPSNKVFAYVVDLKFIKVTIADDGKSIIIQKIDTQNNNAHR